MMAAQSSNFTLITGASSGIGLEFARLVAADNRALILVARNSSRLEAVENELKSRVPLHAIAEDLSLPGAAERVYEHVQSLGVEVECLINNAGIGDYGRFSTSGLPRQVEMISTNITALTLLTRLFLPAMMKRGHGHILNVASVTGFLPGPLLSVYSSTKHYVLAFSEALIEELRGSGVKVTALCPPPVGTSFSQGAGISPANFMATTKTRPADVARYGYQMMKQGKPIAVYSPLYKFLTSIGVRVMPRFALRRLMRHLYSQGSQ